MIIKANQPFNNHNYFTPNCLFQNMNPWKIQGVLQNLNHLEDFQFFSHFSPLLFNLGKIQTFENDQETLKHEISNKCLGIYLDKQSTPLKTNNTKIKFDHWFSVRLPSSPRLGKFLNNTGYLSGSLPLYL